MVGGTCIEAACAQPLSRQMPLVAIHLLHAVHMPRPTPIVLLFRMLLLMGAQLLTELSQLFQTKGLQERTKNGSC